MRGIAWSFVLLVLSGCGSFGTLNGVTTAGRVEEKPRGLTVTRDRVSQPVLPGMAILKGDIIETAPDTAAEIRFNGATAVLMPGTKISISNPSIFEWFGEVWINGLFETHTKYVTAASKGTKYLVRQRQTEPKSEVIVLEGAVECSPPKPGAYKPYTLTRDRKATVTGNANKSGLVNYTLAPSSLGSGELTEIKKRLTATGLVSEKALGASSGVQTKPQSASALVDSAGATLTAMGKDGPVVIFPPDQSKTTPTLGAIDYAAHGSHDMVPPQFPASGTTLLGSRFEVLLALGDFVRNDPVQIISQPLAQGSPCDSWHVVVGLGKVPEPTWPNANRSSGQGSWMFFAAVPAGNRVATVVPTSPKDKPNLKEEASSQKTILAVQFACSPLPNAKIPELTGLSLRDADEKLRAAGFRRGALKSGDGKPGMARDTVSEQWVTPGLAPGSIAPGGTAIDLTLAGAPPPSCPGRTGYYCAGNRPNVAVRCERSQQSEQELRCANPNGLARCDPDGRATVENGSLVCD